MINSGLLATRPSAGGGGSYTGPLDIVAGAVVAYSQRAMSAATRGTPVYTIRRDSDDATQSFSSDATTGAVDAAAIAAFIGGGAGFTSLWNDQSGNASNGVQATAGAQPQWLPNLSNAKPGLSFAVATSQFLGTAENVSWTTSDFTEFAVLRVRELVGGGYILAGTGVGGPDFGTSISSGAGNVGTFSDDVGASNGNGGALDATLDTAVYYLLDLRWGSATLLNGFLNGAALVFSADYIYGSGASMPGAFPMAVGGNDAASPTGTYDGDILEVVAYNSLLSAPDRLAIRTNMAAYYGITL